MKSFYLSLYTVFPARTPVLNSTQYFELVKFEPDATGGLGWSAGKQAAFQFAALVLTLVLAIFGGLLTGKLWNAVCIQLLITLYGRFHGNA